MRCLKRFGSTVCFSLLSANRSPAAFISTSGACAAPFRPRAFSRDNDKSEPFGYEPQVTDDAPFGSRKSFGSSSGGRGQNGSYTGGPGSSLAPKAHLQETPTKDRMPPSHYNPADPRRRLAVLIDGSRVDAATYASSIEPAIYQFGVPIIVRVFDTELRDGWLELVEPATAAYSGAGANTAASSDSPHANLETKRTLGKPFRAAEADELKRLEERHTAKSTTPSSSPNASRRASSSSTNPMATAVLPAIEWFRMDRFIPVNVQMAADAQHIFDFRLGNKVEGVVFVCTESERAARFEKYFARLQGQGFSQLSFDEKGVATSYIEDGREGDGSI